MGPRMGLGLRATKKFERGDFVVEYAGGLLTSEGEASAKIKELREIKKDGYVMKFQLPNGKFIWLVNNNWYCVLFRTVLIN